MRKMGIDAAPRATIAGALLLLLAAAGCRDGPDVFVLTLTGDASPGDTAPVTPLQARTKVTREPIGPFVVLEERGEGEIIALHTLPEFPRVHLSLGAPDGLVNVALTDNGSVLSASAASRRCYAEVRYLQYARCGGDEWHLYQAMLGSLGHLAQACGDRLEHPERYRSMLDSAAVDFPAAIRVMKARAAVVFRGDVTRCRAPKIDARSAAPGPGCGEG